MAKKKTDSDSSESVEVKADKHKEGSKKKHRSNKEKKKVKDNNRVKEDAVEDDGARVKRGNKDIVYESSKEENVNEPVE